jgi:DNA-binding winged helix-turn-helix (wHTH) protein
MIGHGISKKSPSAFRFGEFELQPDERILRRGEEPVPLAPKAFDALLHFVRNSEHLVGKDELMRALWPSTHVSEANLTNIVAALRKVLGATAIQTVSKHGYRFNIAIHTEPGVPAELYSRFLRAKELAEKRGLEPMAEARELFLQCAADDPNFAPAWAWLGRCSWFLGKFDSHGANQIEVAKAAFRRAFEIDPNLPCAHQFVTPMEADTGEALAALVRLRRRVRDHLSEAESHAGLAQVLRVCGLLDESIAAGRRASELDPSVPTSLAHSLFLRRDYAATIEAYSGRAGYYLDAAAWAALGQLEHSRDLLRQRLTGSPLSELMAGLMQSLLAISEDRPQDAKIRMDAMQVRHEPEVLIYLARHYSFIGQPSQAIDAVRRAAEAGFVCAPETLLRDPWLAGAREHAAFPCLLAHAERLVNEARERWLKAS